ncbi:hypothetical protein CapIbe_007612 [Capra ibex]
MILGKSRCLWDLSSHGSNLCPLQWKQSTTGPPGKDLRRCSSSSRMALHPVSPKELGYRRSYAEEPIIQSRNFGANPQQ